MEPIDSRSASLEAFLERYPHLGFCSADMKDVYELLESCFAQGDKGERWCHEPPMYLSYTRPCYGVRIQELHLPIYHVLCLRLEHAFFGDPKVSADV